MFTPEQFKADIQHVSWDSNLSAELASAEEELGSLEEVVANLPEIYEAKFRQVLASNMRLNRYLLLENKYLATQVDTHNLRAHVCLRRNSRAPYLWTGFFASRIRNSSKYIGTICLGVGVACLVSWMLNQSSVVNHGLGAVPVAVDGRSIPNFMRIRSVGPCWVEVQDLMTRDVLFVGELQAGEQRTIRMRQGLRIRSGRPDLLTVAIDGAAPTPFGDHLGQSWRTFKTAGA